MSSFKVHSAQPLLKTTNSMSGLATPVTIIEHESGFRFMITDAPTDDNINKYIDEFTKHHVKHVVRACEPTYSADKLEQLDIQVHDIPFPDGQAPPHDVIIQWLKIVKEAAKSDNKCVAVHCVAGLGRSPVLVAIALIELAKAKAIDVVKVIRDQRRGAINQKQYTFLKTYKPIDGKNCCTIL